jgi:hypothetical protein
MPVNPPELFYFSGPVVGAASIVRLITLPACKLCRRAFALVGWLKAAVDTKAACIFLELQRKFSHVI